MSRTVAHFPFHGTSPRKQRNLFCLPRIMSQHQDRIIFFLQKGMKIKQCWVFCVVRFTATHRLSGWCLCVSLLQSKPRPYETYGSPEWLYVKEKRRLTRTTRNPTGTEQKQGEQFCGRFHCTLNDAGSKPIQHNNTILRGSVCCSLCSSGFCVTCKYSLLGPFLVSSQVKKQPGSTSLTDPTAVTRQRKSKLIKSPIPSPSGHTSHVQLLLHYMAQ